MPRMNAKSLQVLPKAKIHTGKTGLQWAPFESGAHFVFSDQLLFLTLSFEHQNHLFLSLCFLARRIRRNPPNSSLNFHSMKREDSRKSCWGVREKRGRIFEATSPETMNASQVVKLSRSSRSFPSLEKRVC